MTTKIVPTFKYSKDDHKEVVLYDVFVDGKWVGSRRLAKDAEMLLLHHNAHILDAARMIG